VRCRRIKPAGARWFPGLNALRQYKTSWLRQDVVAGVVMTTMLVPVGIAYAKARLIPGLVLFRWDAPLFFANAELFQERVPDAVANALTPFHWLVVAAEPVTSVDVTADDVVCELDDTLHAAGIELFFAEMKDPVKDKLKRFGPFTRFGKQSFFATVRAAVSAYRATHPVEWIDWEDRTP